MANPQVENGHIKIANEILEALVKSKLNGTQLSLCLFLIRKTYGWNKKEDEIALSQFYKSLPYSERGVKKEISNLKKMNIFVVSKQGNVFGDSTVYSFNKNYESWVVKNSTLVQDSSLVKKTPKPSEVLFQKLVKNSTHTKDTITKDNNKRHCVGKYVKLKNSEYNQLVNNYGKTYVDSILEEIDDYERNRRKKYKDYAAVARQWSRRRGIKKKMTESEEKEYFKSLGVTLH